MYYNQLHRLRLKPICDYNCWHYSLFGWVEGCDVLDNWGSIHESVNHGELCLHPDKKDISPPTFVGSLMGLCAALEGGIIVGGRDDNQQLVQVLIGSKAEKS